ncbi:MAG TPA: LTA synthase family protein [Clostridiaceae bacterium]|nr:LTA synthase family protein [Clostridiaceae bacterium]
MTVQNEETILNKSSLRRRTLIKVFLFFVLVCAFFLTVWAITTYDSLNLSEIMYHLRVPVTGTSRGLIVDGAIWTLIPSLLSTALFGILIWPKEEGSRFAATSMSGKKWKSRLSKAIVIALIILEVFLVQYNLDVYGYVKAQFTYSSFIENNYVDSDDVLRAPSEKRNLVFIYLESVESSFMDKESGGSMDQNLLTGLTKLAAENVNFSHNEKIGGFRNSSCTSWTAGSIFGTTTGLPLKMPIATTGLTKVEEFFPGVTSLGDILEAEGYTNLLMMGSDSTFAGKRMFYDQHGNYLIKDLVWAQKAGFVTQDYEGEWGFEDHKLFDFAKDELSRLSSMEKPFVFTMLTLDTHFENEEVCEYCPDTYDNDYFNIVACSDNLVTEFVYWMQEQDFYENTTVIIIGDHLTMNAECCEDIPYEERAIYNCFLNSAAVPVNTKNREFMATDIFPTTLAALGYKIEGNRLGLGTNLFSDKETLAEELGVEELDERFLDRSHFYENKFIFNLNRYR